MTQKSDIIAKIKKCLNLGKSSEPHEAALARAQDLMEKHGITVEDVKLADVGSEKAKVGNARTQPRYMHILVNMICSVFGVEAVYEPEWRCSTDRWTTNISFIGLDPAPEIAAYCFSVLRRQLVTGRREFVKGLRKNLKRTTKTRRGDLWAEAWVSAAKKKAVAISLTREQKDLIDAYMAKKYNSLEDSKERRVKFMGRGDSNAFIAGHMAGQEVTLHPGMATNGSGEPALIGQGGAS